MSSPSLEEILDRTIRLGQRQSYVSFRTLVEAAGLDPACDFVGASLRDMDFRDEDLTGFDFSDSDLTGADFRRAILKDVSFRGAVLVGTIGIGEENDALLTVLLGSPRGFCAGVVRALDIVERCLQKYGAPIYVRREIVHNRFVVEQLKNRGAIFVEDLSEIPNGSVAVFSAHGVTKAVEGEAASKNLVFFDGTCPLVSNIHVQAKAYAAEGRELIVIGYRGHPQVEGILGQLERPAPVIDTVEDVSELSIPVDSAVAYVTQSTLSLTYTQKIIDALKERFLDIIGPELTNICYATRNRQAAARELAGNSDVVLVMGSPNSSNAQRLREVAEASDIPAFLLGRGSDFEPECIKDVSVVGITASASAPEVLVEELLEEISKIRKIRVSTLTAAEENEFFELPAELRS
jgi:4-hydroxy-3-methylbut-2-en-1-yl diphosphate reductase